MTTIVIDTRSSEAKKMVEFLRSTKYAKIVEDKTPNEETLEAINEVQEGNLNSYKSAKDLISSLKKKASV
jgi:hypothetical protein